MSEKHRGQAIETGKFVEGKFTLCRDPKFGRIGDVLVYRNSVQVLSDGKWVKV